MNTTTIYELHEACVTFYPKGCETEYSRLDNDHIILPTNWEDFIEPDSGDKVTTQREIVTWNLNFLGEGIFDRTGFLQFEVDNMGMTEVFTDDNYDRLIVVARSVAIENTKDDPDLLSSYHFVRFLTLWKIDIDTYSGYGDDEGINFNVTFVKRVPYSALVDAAKGLQP